MSHRVARVLVLVQAVAVFKIFSELNRNTDMGILVIEGVGSWGTNDSCSETFERVLLFLGHFLGHRDDHAVSPSGSSHRETNTGVSTGRLDKDVAWLNYILLFSVQKHTSSDSVLDRTTRVEELSLDKKFTLESFSFRNIVDPNHWCIADAV